MLCGIADGRGRVGRRIWRCLCMYCGSTLVDETMMHEQVTHIRGESASTESCANISEATPRFAVNTTTELIKQRVFTLPITSQFETLTATSGPSYTLIRPVFVYFASLFRVLGAS